MVFKGKISPQIWAYVKLLRNHMNKSYRQIAKECKIAPSSAYRIINERPVNRPRRFRRRFIGRPRKITPAMERRILRAVKQLRISEGSFTIPRRMHVCGLCDISRRTLLNTLHRNGYRFRQARKKGLLTYNDPKTRLVYAKKMTKRPASFWCDEVSFYLDAVSFAHKRNPLDQARAPKSRLYRKKGEGLSYLCTSRGKKEGTGGVYAKFIVGISYGKGVVLCEPYEKMTGAFFAEFIKSHFGEAFRVADKGTDLFVHDGDPSQNSAIARAAIADVEAQLLKIPARSPDINPIENFFHLVSRKLRENAILRQITNESCTELQARIVHTMKAIPREFINNTISSMRNRLLQIIKGHRQRVKY